MRDNLAPPTPGSPTAVAAGCRCPVIDNGHGKGCGWIGDDEEPLYIVNELCRLHALRAKYQQQEDESLREAQGAVEALARTRLVDDGWGRMGRG